MQQARIIPELKTRELLIAGGRRLHVASIHHLLRTFDAFKIPPYCAVRR